MRFLFSKYQAKKKEILEVELDQPTKVKFMTPGEFKKYTMGKSHAFFGGRFEETPVRFVVPFDSVWHVVIEKGSYRNPIDIKASCKLTDPDRRVQSSIAVDAPEHVRRQAMLEQGEEASVPDAEAQ